LDERTRTVRFTRPCMQIDLGGIGKGFAIDQAIQILREAGVTNALLHGGTSTAYAFGRNEDGLPWKIGIPRPAEQWDSPTAAASGAAAEPSQIFYHGEEGDSTSAPPERLLAAVPLENASLSISAVWGRFFRHGHRVFGHVLDPRTGEPVHGTVLAAVVSQSATETDALSTALLTLGVEGLDTMTTLRPGLQALVIEERHGRPLFSTRGIALQADAY
jgi:thiamine biosynthesis lipoprotein